MAGPYDTPQTFLDKVRDLFGKRGVQLPTPCSDDYIVVETSTKFPESTWKLDYGAVHQTLKDKNGNPLRLIKQSRTAGTEEGQFVTTRVYVNDRINQGAYNFSLSWALNSKAHIIVSRSSLVLRSAYVTTAVVGGATQVTVNATPNFTPDATFPTALLVSETAAPAEAPYDTLYLRVTQTFETIPGPVLSGQEFTKIGRTVTLIPPEFLGNQQLFLSSQVVLPGTSADPQDSIDLNGNVVVSSIVTAIDATHSQKVNIARANVPYPVLQNAELEGDFGGAVGTTSRSIVAAGTPPTSGFLVIASSEKALSATETLQENTTVAAFPVLTGAEYKVSYPEKFLAGIDLDTVIDRVDTTTASCNSYLEDGPLVVSCTIEAETQFRAKRTTSTLPTGTVLPTFTSKQRNERGQYVTTVENIDNGVAALPALTGLYTDPTSLVPLGGGNFLRTISTVSDVFAGTEYSIEIPITVPEEFRAAALTTTVGVTTAGTAAPPTLGIGQYKISVRQVDEQTVRTETTALNLGALPITLTSVRTNGKKQTETVTRTLQLATASVPSPDALTDVQTTNLGNGVVVVEVVTVSAVFSAPSFSVEINDQTPEEFRALIPTIQTESTAAGTAAPPTLNPGDLRATSTQVDAFTVRTERTTRVLPAVPVSITDSLTNGRGQLVTRVRTYAAGVQTFTPTAFVEGNVVALGNGNSVLTTETVPSYGVRQGQTFDQALQIPLSYTEQTQSLAAAAGLIGQANTTVTPQDEQRATVRIDDVAANEARLDAYFLHIPLKGAIRELPDVLTDVQVTWNTGMGSGDSTETGSAAASGTSGSVSLNIPISSEASVDLLPEITPIFAPKPDTSNLDLDDYFCYVPTGSSRATILAKMAAGIGAGTTLNPWPIWHAQPHTFSLKGQKASVRANAQVRQSAAFSSGTASISQSQGSGGSQAYGVTNRSVQIRPTIHGAIDLSDGGTVATSMNQPVTATANASIGSSPAASRTETLPAAASVSPTTLAATAIPAIPTSGLYVYELEVEPASLYNRSKVRIRVVDASLFA